MSQFWDTYTPDCQDCKSYEREAQRKDKRIAELERQLAAAQTALHASASLNADLDSELADAKEDLQSTDALADIRREVARECAEIAEQYQRDQNGNAIMLEGRNISDEYELRAQGAFIVAKAIRARFGVTE